MTGLIIITIAIIFIGILIFTYINENSSKQNKSNNSYIKIWAENNLAKIANKKFEPNHLFVHLVFGITRFLYDPSKKSETNIFKNNLILGDAALFEVGCYMFVRLDF